MRIELNQMSMQELVLQYYRLDLFQLQFYFLNLYISLFNMAFKYFYSVFCLFHIPMFKYNFIRLHTEYDIGNLDNMIFKIISNHHGINFFIYNIIVFKLKIFKQIVIILNKICCIH